jgi:ribosomal protein S18 acetylase RimI-like enzyme
MTHDDWATWRERSSREYAAGKVAAGTWSADDALERAAAELTELLPDGRLTPGHYLRSVVADDGAVIGAVWLGPVLPEDPETCFVWDVWIDPDVRGRGFGRATLLASETLARDIGCRRIKLHVFGDNAVARGLYRSLGFVETDVSMRKDL